MIRSISSLTESAADSPNADQQDYIKLAGQKTRTESADQDLRSFTRDIHGKLRGSLWSLNSVSSLRSLKLYPTFVIFGTNNEYLSTLCGRRIITCQPRVHLRYLTFSALRSVAHCLSPVRLSRPTSYTNKRCGLFSL